MGIATLISAKLGRCPKCWRWSFRGMVLGWAVSAVVYGFGISALQPLVLIWPLSFSALWLAHVVVFGIRVAAHKPEHPVERRTFTRRELARTFAMSAITAVFVSMQLPTVARADGNGCPDGKPRLCGKYCCPSGAYVDCVQDDCTPSKSHTCYPYTPENAYYVQKCCSVKFLCS